MRIARTASSNALRDSRITVYVNLANFRTASPQFTECALVERGPPKPNTAYVSDDDTSERAPAFNLNS